MKKKTDSNQPPVKKTDEREQEDIEKNLSYPPGEDIYTKNKEEQDIDPEDTSKIKEFNDYDDTRNNEKDFADDVSGSDLDVPGSDLDDAQEKNGEEDEENNYYSLGGDDHNDLEEDKGD